MFFNTGSLRGRLPVCDQMLIMARRQRWICNSNKDETHGVLRSLLIITHHISSMAQGEDKKEREHSCVTLSSGNLWWNFCRHRRPSLFSFRTELLCSLGHQEAQFHGNSLHSSSCSYLSPQDKPLRGAVPIINATHMEPVRTSHVASTVEKLNVFPLILSNFNLIARTQFSYWETFKYVGNNLSTWINIF